MKVLQSISGDWKCRLSTGPMDLWTFIRDYRRFVWRLFHPEAAHRYMTFGGQSRNLVKTFGRESCHGSCTLGDLTKMSTVVPVRIFCG